MVPTLLQAAMARLPSDLIFGHAFIKVQGLLPSNLVHLKLECFSAGGSIKTKTARQMIEDLESAMQARRNLRLIESSSGNLGIALSILAAERGHHFICVTDPNASNHAIKLMRAYAADVVVVRDRDENGGYLGSRLRYIKSKLSLDPNLIWLNQYENSANPAAHEFSTGPEILSAFPRVDFLFVGAGTTGTLTGISRAFRKHSPQTQIVAVDTLGSVTFHAKAGPRYIPGLGTSRRPEIATEEAFDHLEMITEADAVTMCRQLAARGLLVGGSTGSVLSAVRTWGDRIAKDACVVAISPDMGDRYLDTIYNDEWVEAHFPGLLQRCPAPADHFSHRWDRQA